MSDGAKPLGFRDKAILAAEGLAHSQHPQEPDEYEGAISSSSELDAFYKTALDVVLKELIAKDDPRADELRAELAKVAADPDSKPSFFKPPTEFEKRANFYWAKLLGVVEREKRSSLVHDKDTFKRLGIDERQLRVLRYSCDYPVDSPDSTFVAPKYDVEVGGAKYKISFYRDEEVEIESTTDDRWISTYKTDSVGEPRQGESCGQYWQGFRKTSLADIMDMSAFNLYRVHDISALKNAVTSLLDVIPVRSTDPDLQKLIELGSEIKAMNFTQMPYDSLVKNTQDIVRRMARIYFSLESRKEPYASKIGHCLRGFAYNNPHLASGALEDVRDLKELELFEMPDCVEHAEVKDKREELLRRETSTQFKKVKGFDKLSDRHVLALEKILDAGVLPEEHRGRFVAEFGKVPAKHAGHYADVFIKRYRDGNANSFESLMYYARALEGLSEDDLNAFTCYFDKSFVDSEEPTTVLITASRLIRNLSFGHYESEIVGLLLSPVHYDAKALRKALRHVRRMVRKGILEDSIAMVMRDNFRFTSLFLSDTLNIIENLNYDDLGVFIEKVGGVEKLDFKILNSLTPPQRKRLILYMRRNKYVPASTVNFLADITRHVEAESKWDFIARFSSPEEKNIDSPVNLATLYSSVWPKLEELRGQATWTLHPFDMADTLGILMRKGVPEDKIIESLKYLPRITRDIQRQIIEKLVTKENAAELMEGVAASEEALGKITEGTKLWLDILLERGALAREVDPLIEAMVEAQDAYPDPEMSVLKQTKNAAHLLETHKKFKASNFSSLFKDIIERRKEIDASHVGTLADLYTSLKVHPEDLSDPGRVAKLAAAFDTFLSHLAKIKYSINTDPNLEKARAILEPEKTLAMMDSGFTHLAFILNVLLDSSPKYSREKLIKWSLEHLDDKDLVIAVKAAKLLIGLGTSVQQFTPDVIREIAGLAVDGGAVFGGRIKDKITDDLIAITKRENTPELPLGLFYSMLMNCRSDITAEFEKTVAHYAKIEDQPVYEGRLIALSHNTNDPSNSFYNGSDAFDPEPHIELARLQNLDVAVYRHGQNGENVESMMSALETAEGDITVVIGGHGSEGSITFGSEKFKIDELFERLARRLARRKEGKQWKTKLIFSSCYSDKNIELLLKKWSDDVRTRGKPSIMLSSSGNNSPSLKIADDCWITKANRCKETGCKLTWKEFYRDVESKSFIMYDTSNAYNSNMTLYIDGEILG